MSVRRFIGYFIVLSACSTAAFASSLLDPAPLPAAQETEELQPPLPSITVHTRKTALKHVQVAQAE